MYYILPKRVLCQQRGKRFFYQLFAHQHNHQKQTAADTSIHDDLGQDSQNCSQILTESNNFSYLIIPISLSPDEDVVIH